MKKPDETLIASGAAVDLDLWTPKAAGEMEAMKGRKQVPAARSGIVTERPRSRKVRI